MAEQVDLRKEYFFQGGDAGCLIIHGFTSTPAEVYELGRYLNQRGMTTLGILLKGHGTDPEDFGRSTELDWIDSAREGLERLRKICKTVYVAGHSMGGLLALYLAEHEPVDKLVLLAPAVAYRQRITYLAGVFKGIVKNFTWPDWQLTEEQKPYMLQYKTFPMANVHKMTKLQRLARKELSLITAPTLLVMARNDAQVHVRTAKILQNAMTAPLEVLWLETSGHSVAVDNEKETVFKACAGFLENDEQGR